MAIISLAYTSPINPSGASPVLTQAQVWTGLKRKVRRAYEFVPVITACEVISEEDTENGYKVVRQATFAPGIRDGGNTVQETCLHYAPTRVDFHQEDGTNISNIVSKGADGELLMTYAFEFRHPDVAEGSEEAKDIQEKYWKMSKMAVDGSIATIRRFVQEGEIV
ncbi:hypothetical protein G7Z17_g1455 [Cylindrodendrum hubeiense]|uniref:DUF1857-domain-containing protein n=1 Tax=Cylindrodendrum hubeiense TaxID=595255 RepID=A0A9P5HET8_9HYPO|nr:hypothetical protein G7Z17_g1455 [Cylindrodendrum hubeiense]